MNTLIEHFNIGELAYSSGKFKEAYQAFLTCSSLMPNIPQPWENMAVCLAAQGFSQDEIVKMVVNKSPKELHSHLKKHVSTLRIQSKQSGSSKEYMQDIINTNFDTAIDKFKNLLDGGQISDLESISFLHALFTRHETLSKQQGRMRIESILNSWVDHPVINHCLEITTKSFQKVLSQNKSNSTTTNPASTEDILTVEALGLIHYTYGNYELSCVAFQWLLLNCPEEQKSEYQKHLATCYSLAGKYPEAIALDPSNTTAWERYKPQTHEAFLAQSLKMHTSSESIHRKCMPYWPEGFVQYRNEEITFVKLKNVSICGQDPMVYDDTFVYAGNRGNYRHAIPQKENRTFGNGIVVFSTNSNNYYHLLIEFTAKVLAAKDILPKDIPIFVSSDSVERHQQMLDLLNIPIKVRSFGILEVIHCKTLYVLDVTHPGHASSLPANLWDCYITHKNSVRRLGIQLLQCSGITNFNTPKKLIYAKRAEGVRSFNDPHNKIESLLLRFARQKDLEFVIFDGQYDFESQIQLFSEAKIVIGIHGAGLTNVLFTPPDCILFELPIYFKSNTLFLEIAEMMERRHIFSEIMCDYLGQIDITSEIIQSLEEELMNLTKHYKR